MKETEKRVVRVPGGRDGKTKHSLHPRGKLVLCLTGPLNNVST